MISTEHEYWKAHEEVSLLMQWLASLESNERTNFKGLTVGSVRKLVSRIQMEIAEYEIGNSTAPAV